MSKRFTLDITFRHAADKGGGAMVVTHDLAVIRKLERDMSSAYGRNVRRWEGQNGNAVYFAPADVVCFQVIER